MRRVERTRARDGAESCAWWLFRVLNLVEKLECLTELRHASTEGQFAALNALHECNHSTVKT